MAAIAISDNKIENEFLHCYMSSTAYSEDEFRRVDNNNKRKLKIPLCFVFEEILNKKIKDVTEEEFIDFKTRFTYAKTTDGVVFAKKKPETKFSYLERGDTVERLGLLVGEEIFADDGTIVARLVGQFHSFHLYAAPVMFAGIAGELICQLPEAFDDRILGPIPIKKSDKPFYYAISKSEKPWFRYEAHRVLMDVYEVIDG